MGDVPSFSVRPAPAGALAAPTYINAVRLAANTPVTITPPDDAAYVYFAPKYKSAVFYARFDGSAAAEPTGTVIDGTASEANPICRFIRNIDTFSVISPNGNTIILMSFYSDDSEPGFE